MSTAEKEEKAPHVLITGGCGFVGINLAKALISQGRKVMLFDNLSRAGVENNLAWLKKNYPGQFDIMVADVRNYEELAGAIKHASMVYHFAAQVAVTTSLENPMYDFDVNASGTLNLLEAIRHSRHMPPVIFTSTNKVYGNLDDVSIIKNKNRYSPQDELIQKAGISEKRNLDFHSPYGCTKGMADQYMLDYARTFGLKTVVFRMSCIYGPHQYGNEDQGWVAHFLLQALKNIPVTLFGDGMQVRDILFIEDLVNAFQLAEKHMEIISGNAFNIGGGLNNTISLLELIKMIETIAGKKPQVLFDKWRRGDQKYYVSDYNKFKKATGWIPLTGVFEGVRHLYEWIRNNVKEDTEFPIVRKSRVETQLAPIDK